VWCAGVQGGQSSEDGAADSGSAAGPAAPSVHDAAGSVDQTRSSRPRHRQLRRGNILSGSRAGSPPNTALE